MAPDKRAVIFGGSGLIGRSLLRQLNEANAWEIINIDLVTTGEPWIKEIKGNVKNKEFIDQCINVLCGYGGIDALVWMVRPRLHETGNIELLRGIIETEIFPLINIIDALSDKLISNSTSVVVLSSIASRLVSGQHFAYNMSKGMIESYVRSMAVHFGDISGVRFNAILPGLVGSDKILNDLNKHCYRQERAALPRSKAVTDEEIASLIMFLLGNHSKSLNGASIVSDGGESILDQYYVAQRVTKQEA